MWTKNGTVQKIFEKLKEQNTINIRSSIECLDSTSIKVHPDACGAKKTNGRQSIGRSNGGVNNKDSYCLYIR